MLSNFDRFFSCWMLPKPDAMTAVPIPRQPSPEGDDLNRWTLSQATPVSALKELVANLHREQYKIQNLLSSLGFALRSFNNLNQFLELIPLMAARMADADGGALVLFKQNGQVQLEQLHCSGNQTCQDIRQALLQATRKLTANSVSSDSASTNPPVDSLNVTSLSSAERTGETSSLNWQLDSTPGTLDELVQQSLSSEIRLFGSPILVKSQERGRLYIFSRDPEYSWTSMRQKLVQLVADQAAVAIANNDLTVELRKKERLDRELEIASDIQFHLLPRQCPRIKGIEVAANCRTANRVGGDYYDFIPANYDKRKQGEDGEDLAQANSPWSIVIGDVMGKGVPAGLIMTMTRGMLRAEVLNRHSPAQILTHLNRVMYDDLDSSHRFVTLFYSEYDPQTQILSYSNAAHNPPLWWQAASNTIQRLDSLGMLIGLDTDSQYEDVQVQLAPGDTILYYTDGFTDAVNQKGDRFEEENLMRVFQAACQQGANPQAILDSLFETVQQFIGAGSGYEDDMTLVVMQVKSSTSD